MRLELLLKVCDDNPGALTVIHKLSPRYIYALEVLDILGSDIWVFYKYLCGGDAIRLMQEIEGAMNNPDLEQSLKSRIAGIQGR